MDIERVDINSLTFDPSNARKHPDKNLEAIKGSLNKFGQRKPIVVRNNVVIAGNGTLAAAKALGWETIDIVRADDMSPTEATAFAIADNRTSELAEWDDDVLKDTLDALLNEGFEVEDIGFDLDDIPGTGLGEPNEKDDDVPEVEDNPYGVKLGDIWQLGDHRLICGDSTDKATVEKLMNGEKADMVFTDPPYGMNLDTDYSKMGGGRKHRKVEGDDKPYDPSIPLSMASEVILFGADYYRSYLPSGGSWYVWDKRSHNDEIGKSDKMFGSAFELAFSKVSHKRELVRVMKVTVEDSKDNPSSLHPTQKPIAVITWFFERIKADLVLDPFLGSGSTLIACEKTGRKCFGSEIDPHYCSIIIKRWEDYTGKQAKRL